MAKPELIDKLEKVLKEDIVNEYQVVYILSRIRKILEIDNNKKDYKFLNIYCNWALHTQIDRTEPIFKELDDFINGKENDLLSFEYLKGDLIRFINNHGLSSKIIEDPNYYRFINILLEIYNDTPLVVKYSQTVKIFINNPNQPLGNNKFNVGFKIE